MNKKRTIVLAALAFSLAFWGLVGIVWAQTSSGYDNSWHVLGAGGSQSMTSGSHTIHGTTGQFAIGPASSGQSSVGSGYWYGYWSASTIVTDHSVYLPMILKNW